MFFYVVATPIGNLEDIAERSLKVLRDVDMIFAEDTRVTRKITSHFDIRTPISRYDENNPAKAFKQITSLFKEAKSVALVTDAGTPAISDPGYKLVEFVRSEIPQVNIRSVPGPSAITSALSVSGYPTNEFTFLGFPPAKKKRDKFFNKVNEIDIRPIVFYESTHRLHKTFDDIERLLGDVELFVAKEITKIHEDYFKGFVSEARNYFVDKKGKGEFVIIIK